MAGAGDRILYSCVGNGDSDRSSDGCWADNSDSGGGAVDPGNSAVLSYDAVSHRGQHEPVCCGRACGEFCSIADAIYMALQAKEEIPKWVQQLFKVYICGVCFYMLMSGNAYYASRYATIFKVVECAVAAGLVACCRSSEDMMITEKPHIGTGISFRKYVGTGAMAFFLCLALVMGMKNLHAAVSEGGYDKLGVNLFTYPYVSVLNQQKINDYYDYQEKDRPDV